MKKTGNFERNVSIQQYDGGYLVMVPELGSPFKTKVFSSIDEALNYVLQAFDLVSVGEKIELRSNKDV